ncbi:MAG: sarcosine oxidase, gamma subunit family [Hyphomicrobiales bacterium]|nr:sarcosine oxidase, gamma subunit family [Hyphomicrobiales bacterium]
MADAHLAHVGPLGAPGLLLEGAGARALVAEPVARALLRGGPDALSAACAALRLPSPPAPMGSCSAPGVTALWLGPDETLLMGDVGALAPALEGVAHALVDVSSRDAALDIEGPGAALLLASGVMLDLAPAAFPTGACARTLLGKAPVLVWRRGPEAFQIQTPRSYAPYVAGFLREAFAVPPTARA